MYENMKERMKELSEAIQNTMSNSDEIGAVLSKIKADGYDIFLILEATVGFNKPNPETTEPESKPSSEPELQVNEHDVRFLKSMKISTKES